MSILDERELVHVHTCPTCKHCLEIMLAYDEPPYEEYFCMLGLSDEEKNAICTEVDDLEFQCGRLTGEDFSEEFRQTMQWGDPEEMPPDCERIVGPNSCCRFYNK